MYICIEIPPRAIFAAAGARTTRIHALQRNGVDKGWGVGGSVGDKLPVTPQMCGRGAASRCGLAGVMLVVGSPVLACWPVGALAQIGSHIVAIRVRVRPVHERQRAPTPRAYARELPAFPGSSPPTHAILALPLLPSLARGEGGVR